MIDKGNDRLSRCASAILQANSPEIWEDLNLFGAPSECAALVAKGVRKDIIKTLAKYNYTAKGFYEAVKRRTCSKFTYDFFWDLQDLWDTECDDPNFSMLDLLVYGEATNGNFNEAVRLYALNDGVITPNRNSTRNAFYSHFFNYFH